MRPAAVALLVAVLAACAAPPAPPVDDAAATVFVGRSADGVLTVAVAVGGDRATAFVSDGAGVGLWLDGSAAAGLLDLTGDGGALVGGVHGRVVHGGVTPADGPGWSFAAVAAPEPAGLYAADSAAADDRIGWIRFADGSTVGVADVDGIGRPAPAPSGGIVIDGHRFGEPHRVVP